MNESIFNNLTSEDFERILIENGIEFEKVEPGKGGVFIGPDKVNIREIYSRKRFDSGEVYRTLRKAFVDNFEYKNMYNSFEEKYLTEAA